MSRGIFLEEYSEKQSPFVHRPWEAAKLRSSNSLVFVVILFFWGKTPNEYMKISQGQRFSFPVSVELSVDDESKRQEYCVQVVAVS